MSVRPLALVAFALLPMLATAWSGTPGAGTQVQPFVGSMPWLVVRCHASDESAEPQSTAYFKQLFTGAGKGTMNMVDYWHDVSFGQIDISGTTVAEGRSADAKGWYALPITKAQYDALSRSQEVTVCANTASADYNLGNYYGILAIYPASDTSASGGEAGTYGPYSTSISGVNGKGAGTFSLAQVNFPSNVNPTFAGHEMGHGFGLHHSRLYSTSAVAYSDGYDIMSAMATDSFTPPSGNSKNATYGASLLGSVTAAKGPGPDAITLDDEGWIPAQRRDFLLRGPYQGGIVLHSLSDPNALTDSKTLQQAGRAGEVLEMMLPAANISFPFSPAGTNCVAANYTLEYRESLRWDAAIPIAASYWNPSSPAQLAEINSSTFPIGSVVLHLRCISSWDPPPPSYAYSLLVDKEPPAGGHAYEHNKNFYTSGGPNGAFFPGDEYADDGSDFYFAVNSMSNAKHNAVVTVASGQGPIVDKLSINIPRAPSGGSASVSALLFTDPKFPTYHGAVPGHIVKFKLGTSTCTAISDLSGTANCTVHVHGNPSQHLALSASAAATRSYLATTSSIEITVGPAVTSSPPPHKPQIKIQIHRPLPPPKPEGAGA
jgi:hypothetical protein